MAVKQSGLDGTYVGTRVTFQRVTDARIFHGWIEWIQADRFALAASLHVAVLVGDRFTFRMHGRKQDAVLTARLIGQETSDVASLLAVAGQGIGASILDLERQNYVFELEGNVIPAAQQSKPRFNTENGSAFFEGQGFEASIQDISEEGLGLHSPAPVTKDEVVDLTVYVGAGVLRCRAEVRYCRQIREEPPTYRIGVALLPMDRVNAGRWSQIFQARR